MQRTIQQVAIAYAGANISRFRPNSSNDGCFSFEFQFSPINSASSSDCKP